MQCGNEDQRTSYPAAKRNISELVDVDPLNDVHRFPLYIMHVSLFEMIVIIVNSSKFEHYLSKDLIMIKYFLQYSLSLED